MALSKSRACSQKRGMNPLETTAELNLKSTFSVLLKISVNGQGEGAKAWRWVAPLLHWLGSRGSREDERPEVVWHFAQGHTLWVMT